MRVLFVYPQPDQDKHARFGFSLNIGYAAAVLQALHVPVFLLDFSAGASRLEDLNPLIQNQKIDTVAVEFDSFDLNRSENTWSGTAILRYIGKMYPQIQKIAFGNDCVICQESVADADETVRENLAFWLMRKKLYPQDGLSDRELFDKLPFPSRALFEQLPYYRAHGQSTMMETSRGCLNTCVFCQRKGWQKTILQHEDDYSCHEMALLKRHQYRNVWIHDENFTYNLARSKRLLNRWAGERLTEGMKLAISSWSNIDEEFLRLAAKAHVKIISMGIESANKQVLEFYRKNIDLDQVKELVSIANDAGIFMVGNFIIGAPMENEEMIQNTFSYIEDCDFDQVNIKTLDYMMGADLYDRLPHSKYPGHHYFCCQETGLGKLPIKKLVSMKQTFLKTYYANRKGRLKEKICRFGTPYDIDA